MGCGASADTIDISRPEMKTEESKVIGHTCRQMQSSNRATIACVQERLPNNLPRLVHSNIYLTRAMAQAGSGAAGAAELSHYQMQFRELRPEDFELLCKLDEGNAKRGTAALEVAKCLPTIAARASGCTECSVCLAAFSPEEPVTELYCKHAFHPECVTRWLTQCRASCPTCTAPVDQEVCCDDNEQQYQEMCPQSPLPCSLGHSG